MAWGTAQLPLPARLPWTLSVKLVMVTADAGLVFSMRTEKVTVPPGSGSEVGVAVLVTLMAALPRIRNVAVELLSVWSGSGVSDETEAVLATGVRSA